MPNPFQSLGQVPIMATIQDMLQRQQNLERTQATTQILNQQSKLLQQEVQSQQKFNEGLAMLATAKQAKQSSDQSNSDMPSSLSSLGNTDQGKPIVDGYKSEKDSFQRYNELAQVAAAAGDYKRQQQFQKEATDADNRARQWYVAGQNFAVQQRKELASAASSYAEDGSNVDQIVATVGGIDPKAIQGAQYNRDAKSGQIIAGPKTKAAFDTLANTEMSRSEQLSAKREADKIKQEAITNARKDEEDKKRSAVQDAEIAHLRAGTAHLLAATDKVKSGGGGYGQDFEKLTPKQQAAVDWYATMQIGGDATWRTGLSRVKGGAELIKAVDEYVPQKAMELGLSAADVGTNKAVRVASQAALTQNTKDIATIKPFASMLDQNAEILKGLADKVIKTDSALANKPLNWLQTHATSNPDLADFLTQMKFVQTEAARIIQNPRLVGVLTVEAQQELNAVINGDMPLASTKRVIERLQNDSSRRVAAMEGQQTALQGKIKEMMGGTATPPTMAAPAAPASGAPARTTQYSEVRTTTDGRRLGKKADGTIEEIK